MPPALLIVTISLTRVVLIEYIRKMAGKNLTAVICESLKNMVPEANDA